MCGCFSRTLRSRLLRRRSYSRLALAPAVPASNSGSSEALPHHPLAQLLGDGTLSSSDGLRLPTRARLEADLEGAGLELELAV
jgi:hypothetical protein